MFNYEPTKFFKEGRKKKNLFFPFWQIKTILLVDQFLGSLANCGNRAQNLGV